jgi:drug/metabolite transporter (DMT)-like permease
VLGNVQVVLVAVIAWAVLGERPVRSTLVAIPIALFGVVLISGMIGSGAYGDDPVMGVVYGLLTAVFYSLFLLTLRQLGDPERSPAGPLFDATLSAAVCAGIVGLVFGNIDWVPDAEAQAWLVLLALSSQVLGWMLIATSLPRLPAVLTSIVLMLQPVTTVLLGALLLDEAPSAVQLSRVAIVLTAVGFATVGARQPVPQSA